MNEPWDQPDYASWRIYADWLIETGAPAYAVKRAVKRALGLKDCPKLILVRTAFGGVVDEVAHPGAVAWHNGTNLRWWTLGGTASFWKQHHLPPTDLASMLATPLDFPGLLETASLGALEACGLVLTPSPCFSLVWNFYVKASENVAVRCRKGHITVRRSRSAKAPWEEWMGV